MILGNQLQVGSRYPLDVMFCFAWDGLVTGSGRYPPWLACHELQARIECISTSTSLGKHGVFFLDNDQFFATLLVDQ